MTMPSDTLPTSLDKQVAPEDRIVITLGPGNQVTINSGPSVRFTGKEFALMNLICRRNGGTVSKTMTLTELYAGRDEPEMKIVDVFICKLRKKMEMITDELIIETVWGKGYRLADNIKVRSPKGEFLLVTLTEEQYEQAFDLALAADSDINTLITDAAVFGMKAIKERVWGA